VARAPVTDADVVLADEPTAELDAQNRELIVSLLIDRARTGSALVIASHDPDVVDAATTSWICRHATPAAKRDRYGRSGVDVVC
jgi:ABC-type lipoprotein export system ATPase subunit